MAFKLTIDELARYPWSVEAKQHLSKLGFTLEDFPSDDDPVLKRATKRVEESASSPMSATPALASRAIGDVNRELLAFPIAVVLLRGVDRYFQRRFALFEAKKSSSLLKQCPAGKLVAIAQSNFKWKVAVGIEKYVCMDCEESFKTESTESKCPKCESKQLHKIVGIRLHFADYLRNAVKIQGDHWKLANRHLADGEVHLTVADAARLMEEEIVCHIEARMQ